MLTVCTGVYLSFKTKYLVIKDKEVYDHEIGQPAVCAVYLCVYLTCMHYTIIA